MPSFLMEEFLSLYNLLLGQSSIADAGPPFCSGLTWVGNAMVLGMFNGFWIILLYSELPRWISRFSKDMGKLSQQALGLTLI